MTPVYETNIPFEDIDRVIMKIYPVVVTEKAPIVIAAMISMIVMAMSPGAPAEKIIKQIEDISQFITMNIMTPVEGPTPDGTTTVLN